MMERLTALIHNFNMDCHKHFTNVSPFLGDKLDKPLQEIEKFFYSDFWESRFKKRIGEYYDPIELDIVQGTTTCLKENTKFKLFSDEQSSKGISNKDTMIALNTNLDILNDSHILNVIMHEFGHRLYNQKEFGIVVDLNKEIIGSPGLYIKSNQVLTEKDYPYFIDDNEIRQRIIPIIKEMYDNNWSAEKAYDLSENLKADDIKDIFTKEYILRLLNNIL